MDDRNKNGIRLQKYLADAGVASRRKAEVLIADGRISVNGEVVTQAGVKILPEEDTVFLDGKLVEASTKLVYIMLHKPEGVITSVSDPHNRPVVLDFVRDISGRLFPVGRLDYDSSGLLLLTNDGKLAQKLTHPSHTVPKTYVARLQGLPNREGLAAFKKGLVIDDGPKTAPAQIKILDKKGAGCTASITIHEGRNRQIRKMCAAIGCPVVQLKRVSMGSLKLGSLGRGKYRHLTREELRQLKLM
ncbi:MAG: rRNA pseudouridine synthase [Defluviitaleaceae bacterium]|nr:rRNA pseudouridine synthase [Defluviitaleaceae bacterium]